MSTLEDVTAIIGKQLDRDPAESAAETDFADDGFTSLDMVEVILRSPTAFFCGTSNRS